MGLSFLQLEENRCLNNNRRPKGKEFEAMKESHFSKKGIECIKSLYPINGCPDKGNRSTEKSTQLWQGIQSKHSLNLKA